MHRIMYLYSILLVLSSGGYVIRSLSASVTSEVGIDYNLQRLKSNFSTSVIDALLKFDGFRRKFDVPYLNVATALTYVREIAKAANYNSLFKNKDGVEEVAMHNLLQMVLPSSPDYCCNLNCTGTRIGEILAEIATGRGFLNTQVSERILQMQAGSLAGNILWRLSRMPDVDAHILETLRRASDEVIARYAQLVNRLSVSLKNSTLVSGFCYEEVGLDAKKSEIISSAVCRSVFLDYNIGLLKNISQRMEDTYSLSKNILSNYLDHFTETLLVPSIIAETIIFNMIKQEFTLAEGMVEEVSHDLQKFIMLGITINRMKLDSTEPFVKYSYIQN